MAVVFGRKGPKGSAKKPKASEVEKVKATEEETDTLGSAV